MTINILGISAYYHDSAAALISDGKIIGAAQEERFTRQKGDANFPENAIQYCLEQAGLDLFELDYIVFYDNPALKFDRILRTYLSCAPRGLFSFIQVMPIWLKEKLNLTKVIKNKLKEKYINEISELPPLLFSSHHQAHAAAAYYPSPFDKSAILCLDGVGEWTTTSVWLGNGNRLIPKWELKFPDSLGLLYSAFTFYTGFKINSGEYKLMGLAPYGKPIYADLIRDKLIHIKHDGTFKINMKYFNYLSGRRMINKKFERLFGRPARQNELSISQFEMDIAASIQSVTEEVILCLANTIYNEFESDYLCLGGGVALNCVANGRLLREGKFKDIWIQPAAGDAGSALGAALAIWHEHCGQPRKALTNDSMQGCYLGPSFSHREIKDYLDSVNACYEELDENTIINKTAELLTVSDNIIGWFQGRMEFGPRALGNRSILADPRNESIQSTLNLKTKFRESFRPFAPAIIDKYVEEYFQLSHSSPYMSFVAPISDKVKIPASPDERALTGIDKLKYKRSQIPAVTHVDYSARIQTVHEETNPKFYRLLSKFHELTGCPLLVNTSFNIRGEPIVCSPKDAFICFMHTNIDYLVIGNYLLNKKMQTNVKLTNLNYDFEPD